MLWLRFAIAAWPRARSNFPATLEAAFGRGLALLICFPWRPTFARQARQATNGNMSSNRGETKYLCCPYRLSPLHSHGCTILQPLAIWKCHVLRASMLPYFQKMDVKAGLSRQRQWWCCCFRSTFFCSACASQAKVVCGC
jgi:hypothetical protein